MPCICGDKVERQREALACILCRQLFHPECCNIKVADLDFIKNNFKCDTCLKNRRSSLSSDMLGFGNNNASAPSEYVGSQNPVKPASISTESNNSYDPSAAADAPAEAHANQSLSEPCSLMPNTVADDVRHLVSSPNEIAVTDKLSINILIAEMHSIKESNKVLHGLVASLKSDNSMLAAKIDSLESNLKSFMHEKSQMLSPKRKRKKSGRTDNSQAPPSLALPGSANLDADKSDADVADVVFPTKEKASNNNVGCHSMQADAEIGGISFASVTRSMPTTSTYKSQTTKSTRTVVGSSACSQLEVADRRKWVHIASFKPTVTTEELSDFVAQNLNLEVSELDLVCYKLVKKDADTSNYSYVNFKLGISSSHYDKLFNSSIWPLNVKVRPFDFLEKKRNSQRKTRN